MNLCSRRDGNLRYQMCHSLKTFGNHWIKHWKHLAYVMSHTDIQNRSSFTDETTPYIEIKVHKASAAEHTSLPRCCHSSDNNQTIVQPGQTKKVKHGHPRYRKTKMRVQTNDNIGQQQCLQHLYALNIPQLWKNTKNSFINTEWQWKHRTNNTTEDFVALSSET